MSDAVTLALIGVSLALVNGVIVVAVGAWAEARKRRVESEAKRREAEAAAEAETKGKGFDELSKVRAEYREEIRELRSEVKELRERLDAKERENRDLSNKVTRQETRISDLEETSEGLRAELALCMENHPRRTA